MKFFVDHLLLITCIFTGVVSLYPALYIYKRHKIQQSGDSSEADQDEKSLLHVNKIIDGSSDSGTPSDKEKAKSAFAKWQIFQKKMFRKASKEQLRKWKRYMREDSIDAFKFNYFDLPPSEIFNDGDIPSKGLSLFHENCFTEAFPSDGHESFDTWAIQRALVDILTLNGISEKDSGGYYTHIKQHFVNHKMARGIIQFDLYEPHKET